MMIIIIIAVRKGLVVDVITRFPIRYILLLAGPPSRVLLHLVC